MHVLLPRPRPVRLVAPPSSLKFVEERTVDEAVDNCRDRAEAVLTLELPLALPPFLFFDTAILSLDLLRFPRPLPRRRCRRRQLLLALLGCLRLRPGRVPLRRPVGVLLLAGSSK